MFTLALQHELMQVPTRDVWLSNLIAACTCKQSCVSYAFNLAIKALYPYVNALTTKLLCLTHDVMHAMKGEVPCVQRLRSHFKIGGTPAAV